MKTFSSFFKPLEGAALRRLTKARGARPSTSHAAFASPDPSCLQPFDCAQGLRPSSVKPARRAGFTLMEMLVVIVIIAILIGMLGGAYLAARNHAKRARAEAQLRELVKAWTLYYQTYTNWPATVGPGVNVPMSYTTLLPLFATLADGSPNPDNRQAFPFLSIKIQPGETYCDPWGNPYKISFNNGQDNQEVALRIAVGFPNRDRYR